ncbi:MAG: hypothetical protein H6574_17725 [Lewinellaceae bacterium]|nr:hypothetical protein [Saprospiraceae bacterium]MCB9332910.1 hypothetical protein [Lewinellaceae bacterium]
MRQQNLQSFLPVFFLLTGLFTSFSTFATDPSLTVSLGLNNVATFSVADLPEVSGEGSGLRIFLSHGDGTYFMGTPQELAQHTHEYANSQSYSAFAEVVAIYDKDRRKSGKTAMVAVQTNSTPSTTTPPSTIGAVGIQLKRTTNPVPDDYVTYIVTYEHPAICTDVMNGDILFAFDPQVFETQSIQVNTYFQESRQAQYDGQVYVGERFSFQGIAPGEQRSFFIRLLTKSTATPGALMNIPTTVQLAFQRPNPGSCTTQTSFSSSIAGEVVLDSHDPNCKTVLQSDWTPGGSVTWRIDFQNEGNAAENKVVIADWIDTLVSFNSVKLVASRFPVADILVEPETREVRFVMEDINLRGLGELNASEADTRGYIILQANVREQVGCNAIANGARIFFGCKPPVSTRTVVATMPCKDAGGRCKTVFDGQIGPVAIPSAGEPLLRPADLDAGLLDKLGAAGWVYKWYPAEGLNDPFALFPVLKSPVQRTYTLVASNSFSCERAILEVSVQPEKPLQLTVKQEAIGGCDCQAIWNLTATVSGSAKDADLVWQDCTSGVPAWSGTQLLPQTIYIGVWNTQTGQMAETWVTLPGSCSKSGAWAGYKKLSPPQTPEGVQPPGDPNQARIQLSGSKGNGLQNAGFGKGDQPDLTPAQARLRFWPNPARDQITVQLEGLSGQGGRLVLRTTSGNKVQEWPVQNTRLEISRAGLPVGLYRLELYDNAQLVAVEKLVWVN